MKRAEWREHLGSSKRLDWETPSELFRDLDDEFHFTLDVAASSINAKCAKFFTEQDDALKQPWTGICWMNPPYGQTIVRWVRKAALSAKAGATVVGLLFARTDTNWFHGYVYKQAEIRFLMGRVRFVGGKFAAPFPSMIVIWRPPAC